MDPTNKPEHKQPNYVGVFIALAVLTALEIGVTYLPVQRIYVLIPLAVAKASLVALYFMHLKFDQKIYRIIFVMGILMGISLIIAMAMLFSPSGSAGMGM